MIIVVSGLRLATPNPAENGHDKKWTQREKNGHDKIEIIVVSGLRLATPKPFRKWT